MEITVAPFLNPTRPVKTEMDRTMSGAVLRELGRPLQIESEIEIPELKRGQVLVEVAYSGVCHSQLMEARGGRGEDKYLPHLLGHEATGVVSEIGADVSKVKVGDRVILGWIKGAGIEAGGAVYKRHGVSINSGGVTTFSTHTVVSENRITLLPKSIPMDLGVLFGCALLTGGGIVVNQLEPKENSTIAVIGLGGIGLSALLAAATSRPKMLIAVDVSESKLALAKELGATHTILSSDWVSEIKALTEGRGVDYVVEAAGLTKTIEGAFEITRRGGGRCVFASHPSNGHKISIDPYELICGKHIEGSWGGGASPDRDIPYFAHLYEEGRLPIEKLINKRYSLHNINDALEDLAQHRVARPLIEINPQLSRQ
jgi:S-(hydroxymethyl)glutathione dehydrogenase/alcohol dehydrogenase